MHYIITALGCKVNQYESQAMEELFRRRGYEIVPPAQEADLRST